MIQWIRGHLTASYVGDPSSLVSPGGGAGQRRYRPRVYRAAVRDVQWIESPADARPPRLEQTSTPSEPAEQAEPSKPSKPIDQPVQHIDFRQPRIDEAHVAGIRGGGTFFLGALFDVRVNDLQLSYPTEKGGRAYGLMTGTVTACLVLPALPEPELAPESKLIERAAPPLAPGELHLSQHQSQATASADAELSSLASEEHPPVASRAQVALVPWLALSAAVCLFLALSCGVLPATLWAVFMLPTVVARRFFADVLPDTRGIHLVGAVLVAVQLACTMGLFHSWWESGCRELAILPLLGVVAVLFPAGLLPSPIPLAINAASLALILLGWGSAADATCSAAVSARRALNGATQQWIASEQAEAHRIDRRKGES